MKVINISKIPKKPFVHPLLTGTDVTVQDVVPDSNDYEIKKVNFSKGIRLKFHMHESEQLLIVTGGKGIVATEKEERVVTVGDIIYAPKGEKHWHGATNDSDFSHIFIYRKGSKVTQLED